MPLRRSEVYDTVQWDEIRARVEAAARAIEGRASPSPAHAREVLEQRAQTLAKPLEVSAEGSDILTLITFTLRNEWYAVESRFVFEVFRPVEVAPLPAAERPIFGVTAWRGGLLPVIDLRSLLGLAGVAPNDRPMIFVLGRERPILGVPADAPGEVLTVAAKIVRQPTGLASSEYIRGLTPDAALVLDVDKVLQVTGTEPA